MKLYKNLRSNYDKQARYRDTVTLNSRGGRGQRESMAQDKIKIKSNKITLN